jgi:hypothetical protein
MPSLSLIRLRKLKRTPFSLTLGLVVQDDAWTFGTARMTTLTVTRPYNNMLELINRAAIGEHGKLGGCKGDSGGPVFAIRSGAPLVVGIMTASGLSRERVERRLALALRRLVSRHMGLRLVLVRFRFLFFLISFLSLRHGDPPVCSLDPPS